MAQGQTIRIDGLRELQQQLRRVDADLAKELRRAALEATAPVKAKAIQNAPRRTGRLQKSVTVRAAQTSATLKAGSPTRTPYAPAIHWGWPARNIRPTPFLYEAFWDKWDEVIDRYEDLVAKLASKIQRF